MKDDRMEKILLFLLALHGVSSIRLNGRRYEDIYIVVKDNIDDNPELLSRIQEVFTEASSFLFKATNNLVYFGKIKIIIPKSWSAKPNYIQFPSFSTLDTYISVDKGLYDIPHVKRRSYECGEEGLYMYLTPDFFLKTGTTDWGKHDHVIVHEWGHLRWGLFDEYADNYGRMPKFYQDEGMWKPIKCSKNMHGDIGIGSSCKTTLAETYCNTYKTQKMLHNSCNFCPSQVQTVNSSLMGYQYIDALTMFCDSDDDSVPESQRHNRLAPNAQNLYCNTKSAWEVMREHSDFKTNMNPLPSTTNTTPEFQIIQEGVGYRVFVLDVSGSMLGSRIQSQYQACQYVIQEILPTGSWLGVVSFSTIAYKLQNLTWIKTQLDRDILKGVIPLNVVASTCIGCGIDLAIEMLRTKLGSPENGEIILLTDGGNNVGNLTASRQKAIAAKVLIHTIAVEQNADALLPQIASETGGKHYTYLQTGSISFASAISETISVGLTSAASEPATLVAERVNSPSSLGIRFQFSIEDGIGLNTSVTVLTLSYVNISIMLTGPNNYSLNQTRYGNISALKIPGEATPGEYHVTVTAVSSNGVEYYVRSSPISSDVIRVTGRLLKSSFDYSSRTGELPVILADVRKSHAPVLKATVFARTETGNISCEFELKDNGQDPDSLTNDGTYSGYIFPSCLENGRINIKLNASGIDGQTVLFKGLAGSVTPLADNDVTEVVNGSFQRVTTIEELTVSNYFTSATDTVPPGRITDLSIHDVKTESGPSGETRNFTLKWTAPGDDKNIGKALKYEMKISNNQTLLLTDFDSAENLTMLNSSVEPKVSGTQEALEIIINAEKSYIDTAYFAIRAFDEAGNAGNVSNIISITVARGYRAAALPGIIKDVIYDFGPNDDHDDDNNDEKGNDSGWNVNGLIIGLSVSGGVILLITAGLVYMLKFKKHTRLVNDSVFSSRSSISTTTVESLCPEQPERRYSSTVSPLWVPRKSFVNPFRHKKNLTSDTTSKPFVVELENSEDHTAVTINNHLNKNESEKEPELFTDYNEGKSLQNAEETSNDFEDIGTYIHPKLNLPQLPAPPFFMSNKAKEISPYINDAEDEDIFEGIDNHGFSDTHVENKEKTTELLKRLPRLPFETQREMVEHDHPPPSTAHDVLFQGQQPIVFPAPFSGFRRTLNTNLQSEYCSEDDENFLLSGALSDTETCEKQSHIDERINGNQSLSNSEQY